MSLLTVGQNTQTWLAACASPNLGGPDVFSLAVTSLLCVCGKTKQLTLRDLTDT